VRRCTILHRGDVRAGTGTTAIEHGRAALVIGVIVGGLPLLVISRGAFNGVRHGNRVPGRTDRIRVLAAVTMAVPIVVAVVVKAISCRC
jgi:hypothetical protein